MAILSGFGFATPAEISSSRGGLANRLECGNPAVLDELSANLTLLDQHTFLPDFPLGIQGQCRLVSKILFLFALSFPPPHVGQGHIQ